MPFIEFVPLTFGLLHADTRLYRALAPREDKDADQPGGDDD